MNSKEYVKNVLVTETRDFVAVKKRLQMDKNIRMVHACAGISSEITEIIELLNRSERGDEFDRVNLMEECADICFYIGIASDVLGAQERILDHGPSTLPGCTKHDDDLWGEVFSCSVVLAQMAGELQDLAIKKVIFYGKKVDEDDLVILLGDLHAEIVQLLAQAGFTIEEARKRNIAKLKARYGSKFTETAALTRDLKTERKILEGK